MSRILRITSWAPGQWTLRLSCGHYATVESKQKPRGRLHICLVCLPPKRKSMPEDKLHKTYPHITDVRGDDGENLGALAVTAVLDPSPYCPPAVRIIVGSPTRTPTIDGYIPDLGGFSCGVEGAKQLIATLQEAVRDVEAVLATVLVKS